MYTITSLSKGHIVLNHSKMTIQRNCVLRIGLTSEKQKASQNSSQCVTVGLLNGQRRGQSSSRKCRASVEGGCAQAVLCDTLT